MACDGLALTSTSLVLDLQSTQPTLTLQGTVPELTLESDGCRLTLSVDTSLTFQVATTSLSLSSDPIALNMTTPIPIGTGEPNTGENVGGGAGVYEGKAGVVLQFRSLTSLTPELTIEENIGAREVQFDHRDGFAANCIAGAAAGDLVYVNGMTTGVLDVAQADIADSGKMPVRGVIEVKTSATTCFVRISGLLEAFSGLTAGQKVFAASSGISNAVPTASQEYVQALGVAVSATGIYLDISQQLMRRA